MKKIVLKTAAILLILAGVMISCGKEKEDNIQGNVPYKPCDCEKAEMEFGRELFKGEAVFFKDLSEEQRNEKIYQSNNRIILYDTETDNAVLYAYSDILYQCYICNFPDFAKEWDITQDGQRVYYNGTMYHACDPYGTADRVYTDMVLITLNLK
jgi:hypothetical protein